MVIGGKCPKFASSQSICQGCLVTPYLFLIFVDDMVYFLRSYKVNIGDYLFLVGQFSLQFFVDATSMWILQNCL